MTNPARRVAPKIDLFGWDTVFVISLTKANEAIKSQKSSPKTFALTETSRTGAATSITGTWGDWSLTTNGGGQNIALLCPITSGTFTSATDPDARFDLSNTAVEMEFKLTYQRQDRMTQADTTAKAGTGEQHNLVLRTESLDPNDPVVSLRDSTYRFPTANDPDAARALCDGLFLSWFKQHLDQFKHVFSIFIVNQTADVDKFQWLKPTGTPGYAIASTGDLDTSALAVMVMTENRPAPLMHQADPRILPLVGKHAAFVISGPRFVENWLLQGLLTMLPGTTEKDYVPSNDGLSWQNRDRLQWGTFPDTSNNPVPVWVDAANFHLSLERDQLEFSLTDLNWEAASGFTVHVNFTDFLSMNLKSGTDKKGKPYKNVVTLDRPDGRTPALSITTTVSEARKLRDMIIGVVVGIIGAMVGSLIGGVFDAVSAGVGEALDVGLQSSEESGEDVALADMSGVLADTEEDVPAPEVEAHNQRVFEISEDDLEESEASEQQGDPPETIWSKFVGKLRTFGQSVGSAKWKLVGGMLGGLVAGTLGIVPLILDAVREQEWSAAPTLDEFAAYCVESVHWPDAGGFTLTSATLSGAVVLGGDLTPTTSSLLASRVPAEVAVPAAAAAGTADNDPASDDPSADDAGADADTSDDDDDGNDNA
jgi:hypothetical protein